MYLSRLAEFKNQKRQSNVQEDSDGDEGAGKRQEKQPMRLNEFGIPDVVPSNLGDSFAANQTWNQQEDEVDKKEGMMGLLNQFYDLSNNPTA